MSHIPCALHDDPEERAAIQNEGSLPPRYIDAPGLAVDAITGAEGEAQSVEPDVLATSTAAAPEMRHNASRIQLIGTRGIFAPLSPASWTVKGLQLGSGRPSLLFGYGSSGKTLAAQALALAVGSGRPAWAHPAFECNRPRRVIHIDHEQGKRGTFLRYQRLAAGMGLDRERDLGDRIDVSVFPKVYLNSPDAEEEYTALCKGDVGLVIIDALKGATPGRDENDSKIRQCLDLLTRVSENTGATFLVIHHAGKPKEAHSDGRTAVRGSSAIFDASGLVLMMSGEKGKPKRVSRQKAAVDASDGLMPDFELVLEVLRPDADSGDVGASRVVYRAIDDDESDGEQSNTSHQPDEISKPNEMASRVLDFLKKGPAPSKNAICSEVGGNRQSCMRMVDELVTSGKVVKDGGTYQLPG